MSNKLADMKVSKLLLQLSLPAICAQVVTLLYNLVDRIFIGRMEDGAITMAAIGVCAPIVTIVSAFTGMFGREGASHAAIYMGKGDNKEAERYLGNSLSMLLLTSVLLMALVLLFKTPLLKLFGASEQTLPYAEKYISVYILGTVFVQITVGMNYYITTQGFAKTAMITTMLAVVLAEPISDILTAATNAVHFRYFLKKKLRADNAVTNR